MGFIAYVLAWTIIASLTAIICSFVGKLSRFIVNHTPLRKFIINKNKEYYQEVAKCIVEEIYHGKYNLNREIVEEFVEGKEVKENDADISMVRE